MPGLAKTVEVAATVSPATSRKQKWEQRYYRLQRVLVPGLKYSQTVFEEVLEKHIRDGIVWLDAGCGHQLLPDWRRSHEQELVERASIVIGADLDFNGIKKHRSIRSVVYSNLESLPLESESFDLVTCNMVVEHLEKPQSVFREFYRVLRPGGKVIIHTPNALGYSTIAARLLPRAAKVRLARLFEGRSAEDVFPARYRANTPRRLHNALVGAGFHEEDRNTIPTACVLYFSRVLALLELLYIKLTLTRSLRKLRTNLLYVYTK